MQKLQKRWVLAMGVLAVMGGICLGSFINPVSAQETQCSCQESACTDADGNVLNYPSGTLPYGTCSYQATNGCNCGSKNTTFIEITTPGTSCQEPGGGACCGGTPCPGPCTACVYILRRTGELCEHLGEGRCAAGCDTVTVHPAPTA